MSNRDNTTAVIDGILRLTAGGAFIGSAILVPGLAIGLDKPFNALMNTLDKRAREREFRRVLNYMERQKLISRQKYQHGIEITEKGRRRLRKVEFDNLKVNKPKKWDGKWRLVIFDIPEEHKSARNSLGSKLKLLGFTPLQRSVWIYPFPCHELIESIKLYYKVTRFVTYVEASHIDKDGVLKNRFAKEL